MTIRLTLLVIGLTGWLPLQPHARSDMHVIWYDENPNYGIALKRATEGDSCWFHFVRRSDPNDVSDYVTVDSAWLSVIPPPMCDTNAVAFWMRDSTISHLTVSYLSPTPVRDTLLSVLTHVWHDQLGLTHLGSIHVDCTICLPDSIIAVEVFFPERVWRSVDIYRLEKDGSLTELQSIRYGRKVKHSFDFKQVLLERVVGGSPNSPLRSEIVAYDIPSDSSDTVTSKEHALLEPGRRSREGPLYYIREYGDSRELWKHMPDGTEQPVVQVEEPEYVSKYFLNLDYLSVHIKNRLKDSGRHRTMVVKE